MMKKKYMAPRLKQVLLDVRHCLLAASATGFQVLDVEAEDGDFGL
jgi:hypothetical protein